MTRASLGFSLIELLISLTLSIFLIAGLLQVFLQYKLNTQEQELETQLVSQVYLAEDFFRQALYSAGYAGCRNWDELNNTMAVTFHPPTQPCNIIQGELIPDEKGNDIISISNADVDIHYLAKDVKPNGNLAIKNSFSAKQAIVISDCHHADLFLTDKKLSHPLIHPAFSQAYAKNSQIFAWHQRRYYIKKTSRQDNNGHSIYALYRQEFPFPREELAEYITGLHISYAARADANDFVAANKVSNWQAIKIVKINLIATAPFQQKIVSKESSFLVTLRNRVG